MNPITDFDPYAIVDQGEDDDASHCDTVEAPPFAIVDALPEPSAEERADVSQLPSSSSVSHSFVKEKLGQESAGSSQETAQTALGSSILYSPQSQSNTNDNSGFVDAEIEFDAAASLLAASPFLGRSSVFLGRNQPSPTDASMGFSQLMEVANGRPQDARQLPVLPEDHEMDVPVTVSMSSSILTPKVGNCSLLGIFRASDFSSSAEISHSTPPTAFEKRGIETTRLDRDCFEAIMHIYTPCSVSDAMDIIGNPDMLRLWCEPVRTLVVTRSSEGSRSATNRADPDGDREYDGEWVEATTSPLTTTPQHTSAFYRFGQFLWSHFGFPSYGRITMFVERQRGKVGLTMGPFPGHQAASHSISVVQREGFVKVTDRVRISLGEEEYNDHWQICCGLCDVLQRCWMPKLDGHIEQSMASLTRLRVMIENGESSEPPDLILDGEEEGASKIPLLS